MALQETKSLPNGQHLMDRETEESSLETGIFLQAYINNY